MVVVVSAVVAIVAGAAVVSTTSQASSIVSKVLSFMRENVISASAKTPRTPRTPGALKRPLNKTQQTRAQCGSLVKSSQACLRPRLRADANVLTLHSMNYRELHSYARLMRERVIAARLSRRLRRRHPA